MHHRYCISDAFHKTYSVTASSLQVLREDHPPHPPRQQWSITMGPPTVRWHWQAGTAFCFPVRDEHFLTLACSLHAIMPLQPIISAAPLQMMWNTSFTFDLFSNFKYSEQTFRSSTLCFWRWHYFILFGSRCWLAAKPKHSRSCETEINGFYFQDTCWVSTTEICQYLIWRAVTAEISVLAGRKLCLITCGETFGARGLFDEMKRKFNPSQRL